VTREPESGAEIVVATAGGAVTGLAYGAALVLVAKGAGLLFLAALVRLCG
jgi:hypothetical protein